MTESNQQSQGAPPSYNDEAVARADKELEQFDDFLLQKMRTQRLSRPERAILKTYLVYKEMKAF